MTDAAHSADSSVPPPSATEVPTESETSALAESAMSPEAEVSTAVPTEQQMPSSQPLLVKALWGSGIATLLLLLVCGGIGWLIAGAPGFVGGALGAAFAGVFLGLTIASIAFANRLIGSDFYVIAFFSIVVGGWVLKFVGFIVAAVILRDQDWLEPRILFFSLIAGVLVSLVIDVIIVTKSRLPYISDPSSGR